MSRPPSSRCCGGEALITLRVRRCVSRAPHGRCTGVQGRLHHSRCRHVPSRRRGADRVVETQAPSRAPRPSEGAVRPTRAVLSGERRSVRKTPKPPQTRGFWLGSHGADDGTRTHDTWLGKPVLYQLSYVRAAWILLASPRTPSIADAASAAVRRGCRVGYPGMSLGCRTRPICVRRTLAAALATGTRTVEASPVSRRPRRQSPAVPTGAAGGCAPSSGEPGRWPEAGKTPA